MTAAGGACITQVATFSADPFGGNLAVVCALPAWPHDRLLQQIAAQHSGLETAFLIMSADKPLLRWFSTTQEVPLCGHAALAAGFVYLRQHPKLKSVSFTTVAGDLKAEHDGEARIRLRLPAHHSTPIEPPPAFSKGLGQRPTQVLKAAGNYYAIFDDAEQVRALTPHFEALMSLHPASVCATAPGRGADEDFVSRFFAPGYGVFEDAVSGQPHCALVPFWAERLGKRLVRAAQLSARGGRLIGESAYPYVWLSGEVTPYIEGELHLPNLVATS